MKPIVATGIFLLSLLLSHCTLAPEQTDMIIEADIPALQAAMASEDLTAAGLTRFYLDRIEALNPDLLAVIEFNPDAMEIALQLDEERSAGSIRSPLHGIPVLLKDNIDTADSMKTTAGSLALVEAPAPEQDAFLVSQLRAAGAVILGKTNLSEWANFRSSSASSGWSGRGGQTRNPYDPAFTPCGSSAGSGVAVSANLTAVAVGTETDGSIICPSANNGIVGIKPTLGLVSRSGIIPIAHSQDTAGPMARTVTDAAILLTVMTGSDVRDPRTDTQPSPMDYTRFLQSGSLQGKRLGVLRNLAGRNVHVDQLLDRQLAILESAGAVLVDVDMTMPEAFGETEFEVLLYEFKHGLNAYLAERGGEYQSLADLIAFNIDNADQEMPYFGQELFEQADSRGDLTETAYLQALAESKKLGQEAIDRTLAENDLDALVAPSNGPGWPIDLENGDQPGSVDYVSSSSLAAVSGYASITVPAGFISGRPVGISFFAGAFSEAELIAMAYDFEQSSKARTPPEHPSE